MSDLQRIEYYEAFDLLAVEAYVPGVARKKSISFEKIAKFMCATANLDLYEEKDVKETVVGLEAIDFAAFVAVMQQTNYGDEDRDVFDVFDHDGKGYVDSKDFCRIADAIGELPSWSDYMWGFVAKQYNKLEDKTVWWDLLMKYEDDAGVAMIDRAEFAEIMHTTEERGFTGSGKAQQIFPDDLT